ncbi:MAG TPA: hypothetical protein VNE58_06715 [Casimicrobiaceae bacterium]|nr:hypothetical protein [Casimicrobiaceae bacterium]
MIGEYTMAVVVENKNPRVVERRLAARSTAYLKSGELATIDEARDRYRITTLFTALALTALIGAALRLDQTRGRSSSTMHGTPCIA